MQSKYAIILILFIVTINLYGQVKDENVHVVNYYDSTNLYNSELLKEIRIKKNLLKKTYETLVDQAIDSAILYGGNCIQITYYDGSDALKLEQDFRWSNYMIANIYRLNSKYSDTIISEIERLKAKRDSIFENRTVWQILFDINPILVERERIKKENSKPSKAFYLSISSDSIKSGIVEIGGGGGFDYLFLMMNLNVSAEFYLFQGRSNKVSISNKSGLLFGIAPIQLYYTYPAIKYHFDISDIWFTVSFGREFYTYYNIEKKDWLSQTVDYRLDFGFRIYETDRISIEYYIPIRIGNVIPSYYSGISMNLYYKL